MACKTCAHSEEARKTCTDCKGFGVEIFAECPIKRIPDSTWLLIELCANAADGSWPVAGGVLDQSYSFVEAYRHYKAHAPRD